MNNRTKNLVIGCGGHARFVISVIRCAGFRIDGIIDTRKEYDDSENIMGVNVIGSLNNLEALLKSGYQNVFLAIGNNESRKKLYKTVKNYGFKTPNIVHPSAFIDISSQMDDGNVIGPNVILGAESSVGKNNILNSSCVIEHQSRIGNHCHISLSSVVCGNVEIGDEVFVGANSTLIEKINIADQTQIGAGSTVISDIKDKATLAVGSPHRIIKR